MWPPAALAHLLQGSTCWVSGLSHQHTAAGHLLWTPSVDSLEMVVGEDPRDQQVLNDSHLISCVSSSESNMTRRSGGFLMLNICSHQG